MIDSIGLGQSLVSFALLCGFICFALVFSISEIILKKGFLFSISLGVCFGIFGIFASPYIFSLYLKIAGYAL